MNKEKKNTAAIKKKDLNTEISALITGLGSKDGLVREEAREKLVAIGRPAVSFLAKLINHPEVILHWECIKALSQIADPNSTPLLIHAMSDADEEVRWLAAEGLIAIGNKAAKPILEELIRDPKSLWVRRGVHHFLTGISANNDTTEFSELIAALDSEDAELHSPALADKIIKKLRRWKSGKIF
jgi:HEAT repeat protein